MVKRVIAYRREILTSLFFSMIAAIVLLAVNRPTRMIPVLTVHRGTSMDPFRAGLLKSQGDLQRSGWPWTYRVVQIRSSDPTRTFLLHESMRNWVADVLVGIFLVLLVAVYTWRRYRDVQMASRPNRVRFRYDLTTALLCLLIPLCVYLISNRTATRHLRLADELSRHGFCSLTAELPAWLAHRVPGFMHHAFVRFRTIEINQSPPHLLDRVLGVATLRGMQVGRTDLTGDDLRKLRQSTELTDVMLENCEITPAAMSALSEHQQLQRLVLRHCSLQQADLEKLNRLRQLEQVDLSASRLQLADFDQSGWAASVRSLRLPAPRSGTDDRLKLNHWIALEELIVEQRSERSSDATLELQLSNCPSLKSLYLSTSQKYDLSAARLPVLEHILEPTDTSPSLREALLLSTPPRWRRLQFNNVSRLTKLECDVDDLESVQFSAMNRLREIVIGDHASVSRHCPPQLAEPRPGTSDWIAEIRRLPNIRSVWLDRIELNTEQLNLLASIKTLKHLSLTNAAIDNSQLDSIAATSSLTTLNLHHCELDRDRLDQFLAFPRLTSLTANLSQVDQFHVVNRSRLKEITTQPLRNLKSLRMKNLPSFRSPVVVQGSIDRLTISNAPVLPAIMIECPWPENYQLGKLDRLQSSAAGGDHLDDRLLQTLLSCSQLDQLVLAYPSMSSAALRRIGQLTALTALEVPGAEVDDSVTEHWQQLRRLRRVCLDDTLISDQTLAWLASLDNLRSLSLNRVQLSPEGQGRLTSLRQLSELSLVQTPVSSALMSRLLKHRGLERLDVSGQEIDEQLIDAIASTPSLLIVTMLDCPLTLNQIQRIMGQNPNLELIHGLHGDASDCLPEQVRERIHESASHYRHRHPSPAGHRVTVFSPDFTFAGKGEICFDRPFDVQLFYNDVNR